MEIRTRKGMLVAAASFATAFLTWQFADDGVTFARSQLPALLGDKGGSALAVAFRARLEENQRTYWMIAKPVSSPMRVFRVIVIYGPDGRPYEATIQER